MLRKSIGLNDDRDDMSLQTTHVECDIFRNYLRPILQMAAIPVAHRPSVIILTVILFATNGNISVSNRVGLKISAV